MVIVGRAGSGVSSRNANGFPNVFELDSVVFSELAHVPETSHEGLEASYLISGVPLDGESLGKIDVESDRFYIPNAIISELLSDPQ